MTAPAPERPVRPAPARRQPDVEPIAPPETLAARALAYHRWGKRHQMREVAGQMVISWFEEVLPDDLIGAREDVDPS